MANIIGTSTNSTVVLNSNDYYFLPSTEAVRTISEPGLLSFSDTNVRAVIDGEITGVGSIFSGAFNAYGIRFTSTTDSQIEITKNGMVKSVGSLGIYFSSVDDTSVVNRGEVSGQIGFFASSSDNITFTNMGALTGNDGTAISMSNSNNAKLTNSGDVYGGITGSGTNFRLTNTGTITTSNHAEHGPAVNWNDGVATITNTGTIIGETTSINLSSSADVVINSGTLIGDVNLGGGNDRFDNRGGTVQGTVFGGDGNDVYIIDNSNTILLENTDGGIDSVYSSVGYTLNLNFESLFLIGDGHITGVGNTSDNFVAGNIGNNLLIGKGGNDTLRGFEGDDILLGDNGDDTLVGDQGDDDLFGWIGNDLLYGGDGNDRLFGQDGDDSLFANAGHDELFGDDGNDTMDGGAGNDSLFGWTGNDIMNGGDGDDRLFGQDGDDTMHGNAGTDELFGGDGNDDLFGDDGNDRLFGDAGDDELFGWEGDDLIVGGTGDDIMDGQGGADTFRWDLAHMNAGGLDRILSFDAADTYLFKGNPGQSLSYHTFAGGASIDVQLAGGGTFVIDVVGATIADLQNNVSFF